MKYMIMLALAAACLITGIIVLVGSPVTETVTCYITAEVPKNYAEEWAKRPSPGMVIVKANGSNSEYQGDGTRVTLTDSGDVMIWKITTPAHVTITDLFESVSDNVTKVTRRYDIKTGWFQSTIPGLHLMLNADASKTGAEMERDYLEEHMHGK